MEARHFPFELFAASVSHPAVCVQARSVRSGGILRYFLSGHIRPHLYGILPIWPQRSCTARCLLNVLGAETPSLGSGRPTVCCTAVYQPHCHHWLGHVWHVQTVRVSGFFELRGSRTPSLGSGHCERVFVAQDDFLDSCSPQRQKKRTRMNSIVAPHTTHK